MDYVIQKEETSWAVQKMKCHKVQTEWNKMAVVELTLMFLLQLRGKIWFYSLMRVVCSSRPLVNVLYMTEMSHVFLWFRFTRTEFSGAHRVFHLHVWPRKLETPGCLKLPSSLVLSPIQNADRSAAEPRYVQKQSGVTVKSALQPPALDGCSSSSPGNQGRPGKRLSHFPEKTLKLWKL